MARVSAVSSSVWKEIPASDIESEFAQNADNWSPDSILRAKNISAKLQSRQRDFVDLGLLPALEEHVREKLDVLLKDVLTTATKTHKQETGRTPDVQELFRLVFRLLAAKVLCDRHVNGFRSIKNFDDVDDVLARVGRHYRQPEPVIDDPATRAAVADRLWRSISFENLSVESLAYVYEHTLIDDQSRKKLGIHSTPVSIARYIAGKMLTEANIEQPVRICRALFRTRDLPCCSVGEIAGLATGGYRSGGTAPLFHQVACRIQKRFVRAGNQSVMFDARGLPISERMESAAGGRFRLQAVRECDCASGRCAVQPAV